MKKYKAYVGNTTWKRIAIFPSIEYEKNDSYGNLPTRYFLIFSFLKWYFTIEIKK